jgi:hypothetical protein
MPVNEYAPFDYAEGGVCILLGKNSGCAETKPGQISFTIGNEQFKKERIIHEIQIDK